MTEKTLLNQVAESIRVSDISTLGWRYDDQKINYFWKCRGIYQGVLFLDYFFDMSSVYLQARRAPRE